MKPSALEKKLCRANPFIAGVDEAGRGAWAGPLAAGAVLLSNKFYKNIPAWSALVNDSKKLSPPKRQGLFKQIKKNLIWSVGLVNNKEIDKIGIGEANRLVVTRAINNLSLVPDYIITDYIAKMPVKINCIVVRPVVAGDAKVLAVALASIVAKVYRDELMINYEKKYPGYGFAQHKGYGTAQHQKNLIELGPCLVHRRSYRPVAKYLIS